MISSGGRVTEVRRYSRQVSRPFGLLLVKRRTSYISFCYYYGIVANCGFDWVFNNDYGLQEQRYGTLMWIIVLLSLIDSHFSANRQLIGALGGLLRESRYIVQIPTSRWCRPDFGALSPFSWLQFDSCVSASFAHKISTYIGYRYTERVQRGKEL